MQSVSSFYATEFMKRLAFFSITNAAKRSNDAQIEQYISPINIRVPGYVKKVYFTEHQFVHKGDTLLVLDDREYRIRVSEAEAALKDAENGIAILSSSLTTTQATASVYHASIEEIDTRISKLQKDLTRYRNLLQRNAATPIQVEQLETELTATLAKLEALKKQKAAATSGVNEVTNRKALVEAGILRAQAAFGNGPTKFVLYSSYRPL